MQIWHLPEVDWPVTDRLIGIVKTVRVKNVQRVAVQKREGQPIKGKRPAPILSTNYHATNVELGAIPPRFIHQLGRSRWVIDAQVFQTSPQTAT